MALQAIPGGARTGAVCGLVSMWVLAAAAQPPRLDRTAVLRRAQTLAQAIEAGLKATVAEETYSQRVWLGQARVTKSDVLWVQDEHPPYWLAFRDVFEVDGRPVRDRTERLSALFLRSPEGRSRVAAITRESSRYNVGIVSRTINVPTLGLTYLRDPARLRASRVQVERSDGVSYLRLDFEERARPTLVRSTDYKDLPASGSVWLTPDSDGLTAILLRWNVAPDSRPGRSLAAVSVTVRTRYGIEPGTDRIVPLQMDERYVSLQEQILCTAVYANFRHFTVEVSETIR